MQTKLKDHSLLKFRTEHQFEVEYPFYMRELERNIIYFHQKYKRTIRRTLSQTKSTPLHYKSTKQTAIEFQQIPISTKYQPFTKEDNGFQLFQVIEDTRMLQNRKLHRMNQCQISKELNKKLELMKKCIQTKNEQKSDEGKKENKLYKRILKEQEKKMQINFGLIKPLRKGNWCGFESELMMGIDNFWMDKMMQQ